MHNLWLDRRTRLQQKGPGDRIPRRPPPVPDNLASVVDAQGRFERPTGTGRDQPVQVMQPVRHPQERLPAGSTDHAIEPVQASNLDTRDPEIRNHLDAARRPQGSLDPTGGSHPDPGDRSDPVDRHGPAYWKASQAGQHRDRAGRTPSNGLCLSHTLAPSHDLAIRGDPVGIALRMSGKRSQVAQRRAGKPNRVPQARLGQAPPDRHSTRVDRAESGLRGDRGKEWNRREHARPIQRRPRTAVQCHRSVIADGHRLRRPVPPQVRRHSGHIHEPLVARESNEVARRVDPARPTVDIRQGAEIDHLKRRGGRQHVEAPRRGLGHVPIHIPGHHTQAGVSGLFRNPRNPEGRLVQRPDHNLSQPELHPRQGTVGIGHFDRPLQRQPHPRTHDFRRRRNPLDHRRRTGRSRHRHRRRQEDTPLEVARIEEHPGDLPAIVDGNSLTQASSVQPVDQRVQVVSHAVLPQHRPIVCVRPQGTSPTDDRASVVDRGRLGVMPGQPTQNPRFTPTPQHGLPLEVGFAQHTHDLTHLVDSPRLRRFNAQRRELSVLPEERARRFPRRPPPTHNTPLPIDVARLAFHRPQHLDGSRPRPPERPRPIHPGPRPPDHLARGVHRERKRPRTRRLPQPSRGIEEEHPVPDRILHHCVTENRSGPVDIPRLRPIPRGRHVREDSRLPSKGVDPRRTAIEIRITHHRSVGRQTGRDGIIPAQT